MADLARRDLGRLALGGGLALMGGTLAGGRSARAAETRMAVQWFGASDRARRTFAVIELFEKRHPGLKINGQYGNSTDYFQKINTQIAGRNGPDVFQLEPNSLSDYARRGALLPLEPMLGKTIDVSGIDPSMLDLCRVDGKVYGMGLGLNSFAMLYDSEVFARTGLTPPDEKTSWDDYVRLSVEMTKAAKQENWWGSADISRNQQALTVWLRQHGIDLFTAEGKLGLTPELAAEWFAFWDRQRKAGGCITPDIASQDVNSIQSMPLVTKNAGMALMFSNQLVGTQEVVPFRLGMTTFPHGGPGAKPGHFYRPALIWCLYGRGRNTQLAAEFVNFFLNDPEAVKILGVERGVPMARSSRELVLPTLNELERRTVEYVNFLADKVGPYPPAMPVNAQQFGQFLRNAADEFAFGRMDAKQAAAKLVSDTNAIL